MKLTILLIFTLFLFAKNTIYANDIKIGDSVSSFSANDENGQLWNLNDNLNQSYLVIYFYPIALTGG